MHALFTKPMDWMSIQLARPTVHRRTGADDESAAATQLLRHPDFFCDFVRPPADLELGREREISYRSPLPTPWSENNVVPGRWFPAVDDWRQRPTIVLLHGWNAESTYRILFPYIAWRLNRAGLNAVMIELPYHAHRKPRGRGAVTNFLSDDLLQVISATRQALADTRALIAWLEERGAPFVGLWGFSLGSWLSGLLACNGPRLGAVVLSMPVSRIDRVIEELDFCRAIKRRLAEVEVELGPLNLASYRPKISPEKILLVASEHDLFAPLETVEELWRAWDKPVMWRVRHGHISALLSAPTMERVVAWLAQASGAARI
jgi:dienelactone hydrolase